MGKILKKAYSIGKKQLMVDLTIARSRVSDVRRYTPSMFNFKYETDRKSVKRIYNLSLKLSDELLKLRDRIKKD